MSAFCLRAVVATRTRRRYVRVIERRRRPGIRRMALLAIVTAHNMVYVLARRR